MLKMPEIPGLLVFGGTFDPPHRGHSHCVHLAQKAFPGVRILVIPGACPAGAAGQHKSPSADFEHRVSMCRLAFQEEVKAGKAEVSRLESFLPSPNYTLNTLKALTEKYPGIRQAIILGYDQWESFPRWQNPSEILNLVSVVVVPRPEFGAGAPGGEEGVRRVLKACGHAFEKREGEAFFRLPPDTWVLFLGQAEPVRVSSSDIRLSPEADRSELCPAVRAYINQNGLYQS